MEAGWYIILYNQLEQRFSMKIFFPWISLPGPRRGPPGGPLGFYRGGGGARGISHGHRMVHMMPARILRGGRGGAGGAHLRTVVHKWTTMGRMWAPVGLACVPPAPTCAPLGPSGAPVGHMCTLASASEAHDARSLAIPCAPLAHQCADVLPLLP